MPEPVFEDLGFGQGLQAQRAFDEGFRSQVPHSLGAWENIGFGFDLPGRGLRKIITGFTGAGEGEAGLERIWSGLKDWGNLAWWLGTAGFGERFVDEKDTNSFGAVLDFFVDPTLLVSFVGSAPAKFGGKLTGIIAKTEQAAGLAKGTLRGEKLATAINNSRKVFMENQKVLAEAAKITDAEQAAAYVLKGTKPGDVLYKEVMAVANESFGQTTNAFQHNLVKKATRNGGAELKGVLSDDTISGLQKLADKQAMRAMPASERNALLEKAWRETIESAAKSTQAVAPAKPGLPGLFGKLFKGTEASKVGIGEEVLGKAAGTLAEGGKFVQVPAIKTGGMEWSYKNLTDILPLKTLGRLLPKKAGWLKPQVGEFADLRKFLGSYIPDLPVLKLPAKFLPGGVYGEGLTSLKYAMPSWWALKGLGKFPGEALVKAFTRGEKGETSIAAAIYDTYQSELTAATQKAQNRVLETIGRAGTDKVAQTTALDALKNEFIAKALARDLDVGVYAFSDDALKLLHHIDNRALEAGDPYFTSTLKDKLVKAYKERNGVLPREEAEKIALSHIRDGLKKYNFNAPEDLGFKVLEQDAQLDASKIIENYYQENAFRNAQVKGYKDLGPEQYEALKRIANDGKAGPEGGLPPYPKTPKGGGPVPAGIPEDAQFASRLRRGQAVMAQLKAIQRDKALLKKLGKTEEYGALVRTGRALEAELARLRDVAGTYADTTKANRFTQVMEGILRKLEIEPKTIIPELPQDIGSLKAELSNLNQRWEAHRAKVLKEGLELDPRMMKAGEDLQSEIDRVENLLKKHKGQRGAIELPPIGDFFRGMKERFVSLFKETKGLDARIAEEKKLFGFSATEEAVLTGQEWLEEGRRILHNLHPEDRKLFGRTLTNELNDLEKFVETGQAIDIDATLRNVQGEVRKILDAGSEIYSPSEVFKKSVARADDAVKQAKASGIVGLEKNLKSIEDEIARLKDPKSGVPDTEYLNTLTKQLEDITEGRLPIPEEVAFRRRVLDEGGATTKVLKDLKDDARRDVINGEARLSQFKKEYKDISAEFERTDISKGRKERLFQRLLKLDEDIADTTKQIELDKQSIQQADYELDILSKKRRKTEGGFAAIRKGADEGDEGPRLALKIAAKDITTAMRDAGMEVPDWATTLLKNPTFRDVPNAISEIELLIGNLESVALARNLNSPELKLLAFLQDHKKNIEQSMERYLKQSVEGTLRPTIRAKKVQALEQDRDRILRDLDRIRRAAEDPRSFKETLRGMTDAQKNVYINELIQKHRPLLERRLKQIEEELLPPGGRQKVGGEFEEPAPMNSVRRIAKRLGLNPDDIDTSWMPTIAKVHQARISRDAKEVQDGWRAIASFMEQGGDTRSAAAMADELVQVGKFQSPRHREAWFRATRAQHINKQVQETQEHIELLTPLMRAERTQDPILRRAVQLEVDYLRYKENILSQAMNDEFRLMRMTQDNLPNYLKVIHGQQHRGFGEIKALSEPMTTLQARTNDLGDYFTLILERLTGEEFRATHITANGLLDVGDRIKSIADEIGEVAHRAIAPHLDEAKAAFNEYKKFYERHRLYIDNALNDAGPGADLGAIVRKDPWAGRMNAAQQRHGQAVRRAFVSLDAEVQRLRGQLPPGGTPDLGAGFPEGARRLSKEELSSLSKEVLAKNPDAVREAVQDFIGTEGREGAKGIGKQIAEDLGLPHWGDIIDDIETQLMELGVDPRQFRAEFMKDADELVKRTEKLRENAASVLKDHTKILAEIETKIGASYKKARPDWIAEALNTKGNEDLVGVLKKGAAATEKEMTTLKTLMEKPGRTAGQLKSIRNKLIEREDNLNLINDILDRIEQKGYYGADDITDLPVAGIPAKGGRGGRGGGKGGKGQTFFEGMEPEPKKPEIKTDFPLDRTFQGVLKGVGERGSKPGKFIQAVETFNREAGAIPSIIKKLAGIGISKNDPVAVINRYNQWIRSSKVLKALTEWSKQAGFKAASTTGFDVGGASIIYPAFHVKNSLTFATQSLVNEMSNVDEGLDAIVSGLPHALQGAGKSVLSLLNVLLKTPYWIAKSKPPTWIDNLLQKNWFSKVGNEASRIAFTSVFEPEKLASMKLSKPVRIKVEPGYYQAEARNSHAMAAGAPERADFLSKQAKFVEGTGDLDEVFKQGYGTIEVDNARDLHRMATEHDVSQGFTSTELFQEQLAGKKKALPRGTMESVETAGRLSMWVSLLQNEGLSANRAAQIVRDVFFDYATIGRADRTARAILPFAKYSMEALPKAAKTAFRRPGLVQSIRHGPEVLGFEETEPRGYGDELVLTFPGGTAGVGFPSVFEEFSKVGSRDGASRTLQKIASNLNPVFKVPLEAVMGRTFYADKPYGKYDFFQALLSGVGLSRVASTINRMTDNGIRGLVETFYQAKEPTIMERWLPIITGLTYKEIQKDKEYERMVKTWLEDLVRRGEPGLHEFRSFYTRPEAPEALRRIVEEYQERKRNK